MKKMLLRLFCLLWAIPAIAQQPGAPIDVKHYEYRITLSDASDRIQCEAHIRFNTLRNINAVDFDLVKAGKNGKGMDVSSVSEGNQPLLFEQTEQRLHIVFENSLTSGTTKDITIQYAGIPADGLIIAKNKFNHRGFFADNWPNRAHNWIPCIDHPADKATVDFVVTAPLHYQVVANGVQVESTVLNNDTKLTHYREAVPIAPKVMVIGVADFAVQYAGDIDCIPVYSWVYPENKNHGFYDYAQALEILPYYIQHIGPYGYRKLANVQSKTRFGGLENANTIFYSESSVTGTRRSESLLAHEIAHQWFGNMASENDWAHLWLSEGFATYITILYLENKYGRDTAVKILEQNRQQVIDYSQKSDHPVVDSSVTDYMQLLNPNSYQKGGWVLHMLRHELGDSLFWASIKNYYKAYAGGNASTEDLQHVVEKTSGRDWSTFFHQWLYEPGQPQLRIRWVYDESASKLVITVLQEQDRLFRFPLDFRIQLAGNKGYTYHKTEITGKTTSIEISMDEGPTAVEADPDCNLLFEKK